MVSFQCEPNHDQQRHNKKLISHQPQFYLPLLREHRHLRIANFVILTYIKRQMLHISLKKIKILQNSIIFQMIITFYCQARYIDNFSCGHMIIFHT